jgi:hypothetical protein
MFLCRWIIPNDDKTVGFETSDAAGHLVSILLSYDIDTSANMFYILF